jgi:hypothetical protein
MLAVILVASQSVGLPQSVSLTTDSCGLCPDLPIQPVSHLLCALAFAELPT